MALKNLTSTVGRSYTPTNFNNLKISPNYAGMISTNQGTKIIRQGVGTKNEIPPPPPPTDTKIPTPNGVSDTFNVNQPQAIAEQPKLDLTGMYKKYSKQYGLDTLQNTILTLDNSITDLEDKLGRVESDVAEKTSGFLVTEAARKRLTAAGEYPLTKQYADLARSRSRLSAEATAKANLISTMLGLEKEQFSANKKETSGTSDTAGILEYLKSRQKETTSTSEDELASLPPPIQSREKYTTKSGEEIKWMPLTKKWVKVNEDYSSKLKQSGL